MRKFTITIYGKKQTIFAETKDLAKEQAKINLGYKPTDIIPLWTREWFTSIEDLIQRCETTKKHFGTKAIEIVESWSPLNGKNHCGNLEILRTDGYFDEVYFEADQKELFDEVYQTLKVYNREITPLEKYHASF